MFLTVRNKFTCILIDGCNLDHFSYLGVAIMPTGQQLYSPTGFLPVPMSSPSGYATGDMS